MQFNDKTKRIICIVMAVAIIVPMAIGAVAMITGM